MFTEVWEKHRRQKLLVHAASHFHQLHLRGRKGPVCALDVPGTPRIEGINRCHLTTKVDIEPDTSVLFTGEDWGVCGVPPLRMAFFSQEPDSLLHPLLWSDSHI